MIQPDRTKQFARVFRSWKASPLQEVFYRSVRADRAAAILSTLWSLSSGGRYNRKGTFEALYAADNPQTALLEVDAMRRDPAGKVRGLRFSPRILVSIDVSVQRSVVLLDVLPAIGASESDLYLPWRIEQREEPTVTQQLGAAARAANIELLLVPSEKNRGASNAVIFPDQLLVQSQVRIFADDAVPAASISGRLRARRSPTTLRRSRY
jgi:RES domain-containing protein